MQCLRTLDEDMTYLATKVRSMQCFLSFVILFVVAVTAHGAVETSATDSRVVET